LFYVQLIYGRSSKIQLSTSIKITNEFIILYRYTSYIYKSLSLETTGHEKCWQQIYYYCCYYYYYHHRHHLVTLHEIKSR